MIKDILKLTVIFSIAILIIVFFNGGCDKQTDSSIKPDTLTIENKANADSILTYNQIIIRLAHEVDSLKSLKPSIKTRIVHHYQTLYDTIPIYLRDDLDSLQSDWLDLEITNLNIIGDQDSIIRYQQKEIGIYKAITHNDTLIIQDLQDSLKTEYKRGLKKGRKQGFVTGVVVTESANIGAKALR